MQVAGKAYITHNSKTDEFRLWNLADFHLGSSACSEQLLKHDIQVIADDPFSFWVGGGDYAEFIGYTDKRWDPDAVADWVNVNDLGQLGHITMKRVRDFLEPIKHKCLGLLLGNHERLYQLRTQQENLQGWLCSELGVRNLGYCCFFDISFWRKKGCSLPSLQFKSPDCQCARSGFRVFVHHGSGYAQTAGGKLNRLVQFMNGFAADIYMVGHCHDVVAKRIVQLGANTSCTELVHAARLGIMTGSYLRTYAQGAMTYGEQRGYLPSPLGATFVRIKPETRELWGQV